VVEHFFTLPNSQDSRILLNTAVREIGLRSVSIDFGLEIFPNGRTSAHFHSPGTRPSLMEELNMEHTGMLIVVAQVFRSQLGISSGPTDLRSWTATKASSTASQVIMYSSGMLETGMGVKFSCGMSAATLQKDSLIATARSKSFKTVPLYKLCFMVEQLLIHETAGLFPVKIEKKTRKLVNFSTKFKTKNCCKTEKYVLSQRKLYSRMRITSKTVHDRNKMENM
jgi:hypothetical protein